MPLASGAHAEAIAERLHWSDEQLRVLRLGAALHDVGKVSLRPGASPEAGSPRPGRARGDPRASRRGCVADRRDPRHSSLRCRTCSSTTSAGTAVATRPVVPAEIPLEGRLLAIADAFDAMTSLRPYRDRLSTDEAAAEVERCAGTQFDPALAQIFVDAHAAGEIAPAEHAPARRSERACPAGYSRRVPTVRDSFDVTGPGRRTGRPRDAAQRRGRRPDGVGRAGGRGQPDQRGAVRLRRQPARLLPARRRRPLPLPHRRPLRRARPRGGLRRRGRVAAGVDLPARGRRRLLHRAMPRRGRSRR